MFVYSVFEIILHLWFRLMIAFIHDRTQMVWRGYLYTVLLFVVAFVQSMMLHQYFHRCMVVGMRIRSALVAAVYKKVCLSVDCLLSTRFFYSSAHGVVKWHNGVMQDSCHSKTTIFDTIKHGITRKTYVHHAGSL